MKKIIIICCVLVLLLSVSCIYAKNKYGLDMDVSMPVGGVGGSVNEMTDAKESLGRIWNSSRLVMQVVAIGVFAYAGIRYMVASSNQKADIKKSLGLLVLGAALVFGATFIIDFVVDVVNDLTK